MGFALRWKSPRTAAKLHRPSEHGWDDVPETTREKLATAAIYLADAASQARGGDYTNLAVYLSAAMNEALEVAGHHGVDLGALILELQHQKRPSP